ncbi:type I secretion system permease/ATPase [Halomonas sp. TD01]|uniref:type I secretion system permease/ATPase n=1 Tax=Halomonas sp. TD01 TaxID=999141 RepID=UPI000214E346|nr:type I secretion system permease/ATPase [Halomonas sp. TD01]EGP18878.1 ABC transporter related protein [Halomonas sp. TD01]CAH1042099.1 Toxin secretion ATP-binding protein [Halomonas sp. TD01]
MSAANPHTDALEQCLTFVAARLELPVSEAAVRAQRVGANTPLTPDGFIDAAERHGMVAALGEHALTTLGNSLLPAVALLKNGRAVVIIERIDDERFALFDPALGKQPVDTALSALQAEYIGHLIAVRARYRPVTLNSEPAIQGGHWFWSALSSNRWVYTQVVIAAALTNFLGLATSLFIMVVYDRVLPNEAIESLVALTVGVSIALLFDFAVKTLRQLFIERAGQEADLRMGRRIFDHVLNLQMSAKRGSTGGFANTLREFESLRDFFASASLVALVDLPFIFLFIGVIYLIGGPLFMVPLIAVPLVLLIGLAVQPFLKRLSGQAFEESRSKQGVLIEAVAGLETIKASGAAPMIRQRWEESVQQQSNVGRKGRAIQQFALNATAFAQQAAQVSIVVYGVFLVGDGVISMGAMIACVILTGRALAPLAQLAQTMTRINQARTSYRALDQLMNMPSERPAGRHYLSRSSLEGKISLQDVSFRYPEQTTEALANINLTIEPGEKVALLGRVGSGKSTLARLLLGIYPPEKGAVLVDDTDIRQIDPADLRHNIGSVLQEAWLFSGTVRQNIAIGAHHPTDEQILQAAKLAGAHDFIARHPQGYDMPIGERGEGLSGGQRQLICLARALLGAPPMLLMDEPTSAMDIQTEKEVISRLKAASQSQTLVVVTHRTSLLALVDRVIIVDQGQIIADGPKAQVMRPVEAAPHRTREGTAL